MYIKLKRLLEKRLCCWSFRPINHFRTFAVFEPIVSSPLPTCLSFPVVVGLVTGKTAIFFFFDEPAQQFHASYKPVGSLGDNGLDDTGYLC